jgi:calcineurin-like phosphoesterase family protein
MKRWITSDWHLGEDRMQIMMRPFENAQDHVDHLVEQHNALVSSEDFVIVVGDAVNKNAPDFLEQLSRFNGEKILIRGNHDRPYSDRDFAPYFSEIISDGGGIELTVGDIECYATHYPTQGRVDRFNLVGHIHSAWKFQLNSFNIGVDCSHFRPHDLDERIPFVFKAIQDFYDEDVWAAYHESNNKYINLRGKKGRYLNEQGD